MLETASVRAKRSQNRWVEVIFSPMVIQMISVGVDGASTRC
jgi:hypothetical protein